MWVRVPPTHSIFRPHAIGSLIEVKDATGEAGEIPVRWPLVVPNEKAIRSPPDVRGPKYITIFPEPTPLTRGRKGLGQSETVAATLPPQLGWVLVYNDTNMNNETAIEMAQERLIMKNRIVSNIALVLERLRANQEENIDGDFGIFVVTPNQPGVGPVRYQVRLIAEKVRSAVGVAQEDPEPDTEPSKPIGKGQAQADKVWRKILKSKRLGMLLKATLNQTRAVQILADILHVECWGVASAIVGDSKFESMLNSAATELGYTDLRVWLELKKPIVYGGPKSIGVFGKKSKAVKKSDRK